jgi:hypothetical protein
MRNLLRPNFLLVAMEANGRYWKLLPNITALASRNKNSSKFGKICLLGCYNVPSVKYLPTFRMAVMSSSYWSSSRIRLMTKAKRPFEMSDDPDDFCRIFVFLVF